MINHVPDDVPALDLPHPLTAEIDFFPPREMAGVLLRVFLEVFDGAATGEPGLNDPEVARQAEALGRQMAELWTTQPSRRILLAGGETTGRLAVFLAAQFNAALKSAGKQPVFLFDVAGGAEGFFAINCGTELDPEAGAERWLALREHTPLSMVLGLAPDFSTPYVDTLLDGALGETQAPVILLGFAAPGDARHEAALPDGRSARDLIRALRRMPHGEVLAAPVGPEALVRQTRGKCAGAAMALLMGAFLHGLEGRPAAETFATLRQAAASIAPLQSQLAELAEIASQVLRKSGRLFYLGRDEAGLLGMMDAAECVEFFSDNAARIRGFCFNGSACGLETLAGLRTHGGRHPKLRARISEEGFRTAMTETQAGTSLTVALEQARRRDPLMNDLLRLAVHSGGFARRISIATPAEGAGKWLEPWAWQFALRAALGVFSTTAHVLAGKTYGNRMIDIRMNSLALFDQAIDTVAELARVAPEKARRALVTAIYRGDAAAASSADSNALLAAAAGRSGLVGRAILLAHGIGIADALTLQTKEPIIRRAILQLLNEAQGSSSAA